MRFLRSCGLSLLVLILAGCGRSDADQLKSELKSVRSWAATARMVGEAWLKQSVPRAYASRTLSVAGETMGEEAKTIQELQPASGGELRTALLSRAGVVGQLANGMREAVEKRDDKALADLLKQLETEEQAVRALAESGGVAGP